MAFAGWPAAALEFYAGLEDDNSKAYWTSHKAIYEEMVLHPMTELLEFFRERGINRKRIGRQEEILFGEQAFFREGGPDRGELVGVGVHWQVLGRGAARLTSNVQRPTSNVQLRGHRCRRRLG